MFRKFKIGDTFTLPGSTQPIEIIGFFDRPTLIPFSEVSPPDKLSCEKTTWAVLRYQISVEPDEEAKWIRLECELKKLEEGQTMIREECPNCGDIMILHTVEDGVYTYRCRNCDREVSTFPQRPKPTETKTT